KRVGFDHVWLAWLLVLPQLAITLVFFIWPAGQALWQSTLVQGPFGLTSQFVGFENFVELFYSPIYRESFVRTIVFSAATTVLSLSLSLVLAAAADRVLRGASFYKTLLVWPYAVAPAI